jgi:hypothetical protein
MHTGIKVEFKEMLLGPGFKGLYKDTQPGWGPLRCWRTPGQCSLLLMCSQMGPSPRMRS